MKRRQEAAEAAERERKEREAAEAAAAAQDSVDRADTPQDQPQPQGEADYFYKFTIIMPCSKELIQQYAECKLPSSAILYYKVYSIFCEMRQQRSKREVDVTLLR